jgi:5'-nucleotidase
VAAPLILVTNDDGVAAPGLRAVLDAVHGLGDVIVSAPDGERSGSSHAMTFHSMLRAHELEPGRWAVSGTPVDCVYFGLMHITERPPDLVISGVNSGYNLGTDVFYSGTVGGAAEAFLRGASALAVSVERGASGRWARRVVRALAQALLERRDVPLLLNVNVPHVPGLETAAPDVIDARSATQPVMLTRLGRRSYRDAVDRRTDPLGRPYYWIGGPPGELRGRAGDDTWAVAEDLCSITPLRLDLTDPEPTAAVALLEGIPGLRPVAASAYHPPQAPAPEEPLP